MSSPPAKKIAANNNNNIHNYNVNENNCVGISIRWIFGNEFLNRVVLRRAIGKSLLRERENNREHSKQQQQQHQYQKHEDNVLLLQQQQQQQHQPEDGVNNSKRAKQNVEHANDNSLLISNKASGSDGNGTGDRSNIEASGASLAAVKASNDQGYEDNISSNDDDQLKHSSQQNKKRKNLGDDDHKNKGGESDERSSKDNSMKGDASIVQERTEPAEPEVREDDNKNESISCSCFGSFLNNLSFTYCIMMLFPSLLQRDLNKVSVQGAIETIIKPYTKTYKSSVAEMLKRTNPEYVRDVADWYVSYSSLITLGDLFSGLESSILSSLRNDEDRYIHLDLLCNNHWDGGRDSQMKMEKSYWADTIPHRIKTIGRFLVVFSDPAGSFDSSVTTSPARTVRSRGEGGSSGSKNMDNPNQFSKTNNNKPNSQAQAQTNASANMKQDDQRADTASIRQGSKESNDYPNNNIAATPSSKMNGSNKKGTLVLDMSSPYLHSDLARLPVLSTTSASRNSFMRANGSSTPGKRGIVTRGNSQVSEYGSYSVARDERSVGGPVDAFAMALTTGSVCHPSHRYDYPAFFGSKICWWETYCASSVMMEKKDGNFIFEVALSRRQIDELIRSLSNSPHKVLASLETVVQSQDLVDEYRSLTTLVEQVSGGISSINKSIVHAMIQWTLSTAIVAVNNIDNHIYDKTVNHDGQTFTFNGNISSNGSSTSNLGPQTNSTSGVNLDLNDDPVTIANKELDAEKARLCLAISVLYQDQGLDGNAEVFVRRALENCRKGFGRNHRQTAFAVHGLAELLRRQHNYAEALPLYEESVDIWKEVLTPNHPRVATALNNWACCLYQLSDFERAANAYKEAIEVWKSGEADCSDEISTGLSNLAGIYANQGNRVEAVKLFKECLEIRMKTYPSDHDKVLRIQKKIDKIEQEQNKPQKHSKILESALRSPSSDLLKSSDEEKVQATTTEEEKEKESTTLSQKEHTSSASISHISLPNSSITENRIDLV